MRWIQLAGFVQRSNLNSVPHGTRFTWIAVWFKRSDSGNGAL
jgi:hypothetical protein